jgi:hypothetical protein
MATAAGTIWIDSGQPPVPLGDYQALSAAALALLAVTLAARARVVAGILFLVGAGAGLLTLGLVSVPASCVLGFAAVLQLTRPRTLSRTARARWSAWLLDALVVAGIVLILFLFYALLASKTV